MSLVVATAPAVEPVSTADAKAHLRVDISDDDALIASLVKAARRHTEHVTWRQLITATYTLKMDYFPAEDYIDIPRPPLQSVASVAYIDPDGNSQTFASSKYTVDANSEPGRVILNYGESWPSIRAQRNAVTITFDAGYGDAGSDVPEDILAAIKLKVGHFYERREDSTELSIKSIPMGATALDHINKFRGAMNCERWLS